MCCRYFALQTEEGDWLNTTNYPTSRSIYEILRILKVPFKPLMIDKKGNWLFWCPNLKINGKCGDYEYRPKLCKDYKEATGKMCIYSEKCTQSTLSIKEKELAKTVNVNSP